MQFYTLCLKSIKKCPFTRNHHISLATCKHDSILSQVNAIDLRAASHDEAINVLRQTPQRVRLTVYRDEAQYKEEDLWDSFTVELHKKPGQGLGLSIVGRR